jgi:hypothetical protein
MADESGFRVIPRSRIADRFREAAHSCQKIGIALAIFKAVGI